jgi:tartrate dehydrogenase/decarboxylase/D-malate dehydrogenase
VVCGPDRVGAVADQPRLIPAPATKNPARPYKRVLQEECRMKSYSIAVIAGDGIGQEVVPAAIRCVDAVAERHGVEFDWRDLPWGTDFYARTGSFMPADGLEQLKAFDAILFGAVGSPTVSDAESLWGLLIPIRRGLGQCINLRPIRSLIGVPGPLSAHPDDIDIVIVRENSEGEYSDTGGRFQSGTAGEFAIQNAVFTRPAVERVTRYAAGIAVARSGVLISATKSNGILYTNTFWDDVVNEVASDYESLVLERVLVDALAARLILKPDGGTAGPQPGHGPRRAHRHATVRDP